MEKQKIEAEFSEWVDNALLGLVDEGIRRSMAVKVVFAILQSRTMDLETLVLKEALVNFDPKVPNPFGTLARPPRAAIADIVKKNELEGKEASDAKLIEALTKQVATQSKKIDQMKDLYSAQTKEIQGYSRTITDLQKEIYDLRRPHDHLAPDQFFEHAAWLRKEICRLGGPVAEKFFANLRAGKSIEQAWIDTGARMPQVGEIPVHQKQTLHDLLDEWQVLLVGHRELEIEAKQTENIRGACWHDGYAEAIKMVRNRLQMALEPTKNKPQ